MLPQYETSRSKILSELFTDNELNMIAYALNNLGDKFEEMANTIKGSKLSQKLYESRRKNMLEARALGNEFDEAFYVSIRK